MKQRSKPTFGRYARGVVHGVRGFVCARQNLTATVGSLLFVVIVWQFAYPSDRALPFVQLDGVGIGGQTTAQIEQLAKEDYDDVPLVLKMGTAKYTGTTAQAGITANAEVTAEQAVNYPWWQRLIPLSLPVVGMTKNQGVVARATGTATKEFATVQSKACTTAPKDAGVQVVDGTAVLDPAKSGVRCSADAIREALLATSLKRSGIIVSVPTVMTAPERTDAQVMTELHQAQQIIDRSLSLKLPGASALAIPKSAIASWVIFPEDTKTHKLSVSVDQLKILEYLESQHNDTYTKGRSTPSFDRAATATRIQKQLLAGGGTVTATELASGAKQTYSPSMSGLQALLYDIQQAKGDYAIAVRTEAGDITADVSGSKQYHPASTYKMFVGWAIIKKIAAGQLSWSDQAVNGLTVSQCFDTMIIDSDNACGEWLGAKIGWTTLNNMLKGIGLTCTNLSTAWLSCANDETLFLHKLQTGQLLTADQADRLLGVMKKQTYRSGIPAGVTATVADKVGFLEGKLHDAGIVYAPFGSYSLTIMTDGSSWSQIADAAEQIDAQLAKM